MVATSRVIALGRWVVAGFVVIGCAPTLEARIGTVKQGPGYVDVRCDQRLPPSQTKKRVHVEFRSSCKTDGRVFIEVVGTEVPGTWRPADAPDPTAGNKGAADHSTGAVDVDVDAPVRRPATVIVAMKVKCGSDEPKATVACTLP